MIKVDSILLSKYILNKLGSVNTFKLQKVIYFIESFHLAYFNKSLVDDKFEAWVNGPVSRKIYDYFKSQSKGSDFIRPMEIDENEFKLFFRDSPMQLYLINSIIRYAGKYDSTLLKEASHSLPWKETREGLKIKEKSDREVPKVKIRNYYRRLIFTDDRPFFQEMRDQLNERLIGKIFGNYDRAWKVLAR